MDGFEIREMEKYICKNGQAEALFIKKMLLRTGCSPESIGKKVIISGLILQRLHKISVQIIPMPNYAVQHAAEGIKANVISLRVLLLLSSILYRRRRPSSIFLRLTRYANWIHIAYPREREKREGGDRSFDLDMCACVWRLAVPPPPLLRRRILYFPRGPFPSSLPLKRELAYLELRPPSRLLSWPSVPRRN